MYTVVFPVLAAVVLVLAPRDLVPAWQAAHRHGISGTFVSEHRDCGGRGPCSARGYFVSTDRTTRVDDVMLDKDVRVGDISDAVFVPSGRHDVVFDPRGQEWLLIGALIAGAVAFLVYWVRTVLLGQRRAD